MKLVSTLKSKGCIRKISLKIESLQPGSREIICPLNKKAVFPSRLEDVTVYISDVRKVDAWMLNSKSHFSRKHLLT